MPTPGTVIEICPECGQNLAEQSIIAHSLNHWQARLPDYPQHALALERQAILAKMHEARLERERGGKR